MMISRAAAAVSCLFFSASAFAAEPLQDRIWYQARAGTVHQAGKGPIALPPSARLRAMAIAENCPAPGGPRGVYKYANGKIWLVGLYRCGGGIGLHEVYPGVRSPPVAIWVSGVLVARLGKVLCASPAGRPVHEFEVRLSVESGTVRALQETVGDERMCRSGMPGQGPQNLPPAPDTLMLKF